MIERYLNALEQKLNRYETFKHEKEAYINDIKEEIHALKNQGKSETEIIDALKTPKELTEELNQKFHKKRRLPFTDKILVFSPLFVVVFYLIIGIFFEKWHPGWIIIFLIPGLALCFELINDPEKPLIKAMIPFLLMISSFVFIIAYSMWLVAIITLAFIPLIGLLDIARLKDKPLETLSLAMPFLSIIIVLSLYTFITKHPIIWHLFILNPLVWMMNLKSFNRKILYPLTLMLFIGSYVLLGFLEDNFTRVYLVYIGWLPFILNPIQKESLFALNLKTVLTALSLSVFIVIMLIIFEVYAFITIPFIIYMFLYTIPENSTLTHWIIRFIMFMAFMVYGFFTAQNETLFPWWILAIIVIINAFFKGSHYVRT